MTARRLAVLLLATLMLAGFALAQEQPRRDPQAVAILQQAFLEMGGSNLAAIRDTRATVQGTTSQPTGRTPFSATLKTLGSSTLRIDASTPDGPSILVVANGRALSKRAGEEVQSVSRMTVANGGITYIPVLSVLAEWVQEKASLEYVGLETIANASVHHIRLRRPSPFPGPNGGELPACDLFLDARTLLLVRLSYPMHSPFNLRVTVPVTITYSDYRLVGGLMVPHNVSQSIRGQVTSEYRITSFAVNLGLAQSEFDLR